MAGVERNSVVINRENGQVNINSEAGVESFFLDGRNLADMEGGPDFTLLGYAQEKAKALGVRIRFLGDKPAKQGRGLLGFLRR